MDDDTSDPRRQRRQRFIGPRTEGRYDNELHGAPSREDRIADDVNGRVFPPPKPTDLPADIVLSRLRVVRSRVTGSGPWMASCPEHCDTQPSLSLTETAEGVLLVHCWGGCDTEKVLAKLGLDLSALYPSMYALQFSKRRPRGSLAFHGGDRHDIVIEPTEEQTARWKRLLKRWDAPTPALDDLSAKLGLPYQSLVALRVGFIPDETCWVFPERDDRGRIVGLVRRFGDGAKKAINGSIRGLTIPQYGIQRPPGPIYVPEGASDTAALHSVGAFAIGRCSASGSAAMRHWLARWLRRHGERDIVVVGDRGDGGAGVEGAKALVRYLETTLGRPVTWALPARGYGDVREQIVAKKWKRGLEIQEQPS